jgi:ribose-phosphate pyrophosphokinase
MLTANALKEQGFGEIYLLVAHCENTIFEGDVLKENTPINKVITTNTILSDLNRWANVKYKNQIKVYDIEELLHDK